VGDLMIDHYLFGSCGRISPEAPVPVIEVGREVASPGGAGNVVNNLQALGADVAVASVVGDDVSGLEIAAMLVEREVDTASLVTEPGRKTSRKTRVLATHQQVMRFDRESTSNISPESETALIEAIESLSEPPQAVLLSDYDKGVLTPTLTQRVIELAKLWSAPVLVDPKGRDYAKYRGATLLTPNRKEAAELTGVNIDSEESLTRACVILKQVLGLRYAMITLSEDGMALYGDQMTRIRAVAREVFDVTGAGDTVLATMGFCMACGLTVEESARLANSAAAVAVSKVGSATVTLDEILQYETGMASNEAATSIQTDESIKPVVEELRRQGKRIVFTNGCFDLLHRGHVEYLNRSRECGDVLIVGLNSDKSVRRLKGPERPVVSESDRSYLIASLRCVDYVVVFNEDTPAELINRVRPDVLTKGADYDGQDVVGSDVAGEVRLISLVDGCSTSSTIQRIRTAA
jgi:D-beta-D-heptose 7-phosphate kinase/D-beta-D-heptose 1-phosphate adenosyltransferase